MEDGLDVVTALWLNPLGLALLYGALLLHILLGLQALYASRFFRLRAGEILQLGSGLLIPPLLVSHIVGTRVAFATEGLDKGYAQELYTFWIAAPMLGVMQVAVLVVAWIHGCTGLYFWLRLKPVSRAPRRRCWRSPCWYRWWRSWASRRAAGRSAPWRRIPRGGRWNSCPSMSACPIRWRVSPGSGTGCF